MIRRYMNAAVGIIHLMIEKIWNLNHLHLHGIKYYIGKGVKFTHSGNGEVDLGKKTWVSDNCCFAAACGKIKIGYNNYFNAGIRIVSRDGVTIGDNNLFGPNIVIVDHDHVFSDPNKLINQQGFSCSPVRIGSNVWIGANVLICQGVSICDRVVVAGNAVVAKSITEPGVYGGVPAKKIKDI